MSEVGLLDRVDLRAAGGAVLSDDGVYRYWLHRRWLGGEGWAVFVMLNPSTADALEDDPTIRRCVNFAKAWGHEGVGIVNLFAARATDPDQLGHVVNPEGPENRAFIRMACDLARPPGRMIVAWGAHWTVRHQDAVAMRWIVDGGGDPWCLGATKSGRPRHPLYVSAATPLEPYGGASP